MYFLHVKTLNVIEGISSYQISNLIFKNSQAKLFYIDSYKSSSAVTSKQKFKLNTCTFTSNSYSNFALYAFVSIDTTIFDLENTNCISTAAMTSCTSA